MPEARRSMPLRSCGVCSPGRSWAGPWEYGWSATGPAGAPRSRASRASRRWCSGTSRPSSRRRAPSGFSGGTDHGHHGSGGKSPDRAARGAGAVRAPAARGARVRSETGLATGAASAPSAAVAVAARIFTRLAGRSALILGAGDTAELAATCLASEGVRVTVVANRTYERARAIAEQLGARALTLDEAWEHFAQADIVLSSTAAPHAVVTWDRVAPAIAPRGGRPLCILDLGLPRDVEPAVAQLENVFLYDIDDLQAVAAQAAVERRRDIPAAEHIGGEEAEGFWAWYGGLVVVPGLEKVPPGLGPGGAPGRGAAPRPPPPPGPPQAAENRPLQ